MLRLSLLFLRALEHLRLREQGGLELGRRRPARDLQAVSGVTMNIFDGTRRVCRGHGGLVTAFANARSRLSGTPQLRAALAQDAEIAAREGHLKLETRRAGDRHGARIIACLPIHESANLAHVGEAANRDRIRPDLIAALWPKLQHAPLLTDDGLLGFAAAIVDDFIRIGAGVAGKIEA